MYSQFGPESISCEVAFQVQDANPNTYVKFHVQTIGTEYCTSLCNFEAYDGSGVNNNIEIVGDYFSSLDKGLITYADCNSHSATSDEIPIKYGNYRIKVYEWSGTSYVLKCTLTYDVRDCNYLAPGSCAQCPNAGDNDITLRYDLDSDKLYLYDGHNTQEVSSNKWVQAGWDSVTNNGSYTWWEIKSCSTSTDRCALDTPLAPDGLEVNGSTGQYPVINWDLNSEPDITNYKVYRKLSGASFSLLATVSDTTTS